MVKKSLLGLLVLSGIFEIFQTAHAFLDPQWLLSLLTIPVAPGAVTLNHITAWFLLLVSALIVLCIVWIRENKREGEVLCVALGVWWIGIGIGIYLVSGVATNLFTDSLKGLILCALALKNSRTHA